MIKLPARHVHLDFHTSEHIPDVGGRFDKKQFQQALKLGKVNHITVFAKCHHSWSYYPTKVGMVHPTMKKGLDLLGGQIEACREMKVKVPIYYTVGWSATDAEMHPEWCQRNRDGSITTTNFDVKAGAGDVKPACSWKNMCVHTPGYRKLIVEQTKEICDKYYVDGFFYDICGFPRCFCETCRAGMKADGVDVADDAATEKWYTGVWASFFDDCRAAIFAKWPDASVFFNGRAAATTPPELLARQTHWELEDLPTTWGGYDKFAPRAKFFATYTDQTHPDPRPMLAMSGKFHTMWGEFGGFKHADAITFEAASMIAYGSTVSFGDQCHPSGEMDLGTYREIGKAYDYVKKIEKYGLGGEPHSNLGLLMTGGKAINDDHGSGTTGHDQGVANMLMESQLDFEVVHPNFSDEQWRRYAAIILTGGQCLTPELAKRLNNYVKAGGSLVVLYESGLDADRKKFLLDMGVTFQGPATFTNDYTVVGKEVGKDLVASPFLNYAGALRVKPGKDAKVLAGLHEPYFDRTYGHYCSHQNTANQLKPAAHPAATRGGLKGRVVYLAHPLGDLYYRHGARVHRQLFINALRLVYRKPTVACDLPSAGRVNLLHQPKEGRYVAHLLYGAPLQRGRCLVIEDLPTIANVALTVRLPEKVKRVVLPLSGKKLALKRGADGSLSVTVPALRMHEMVVFEY